MTVLFQQSSAVEVAPLEDGLMVLEPTETKFCALNRTSSLIWTHLEDPASAEHLAERVMESFAGVNKTDALKDVEAIIEEMTLLGIVVPVDD